MTDFEKIKGILSGIDDPVMRLEFVMDLGAHLASVPDGAVCTEIDGCASRAIICRDGNRFYGDADAALVRGILAILIAMVDGKDPAAIRNQDLAADFAALNLGLGAGRLNGVNSMIRFLQNL